MIWLSIIFNNNIRIVCMLDFTRIKYTLTAFRTKKTYLVFLVGQLALALIIVPVALSNPAHFKTPFVIFLEVLLFLLFAFDLYQ